MPTQLYESVAMRVGVRERLLYSAGQSGGARIRLHGLAAVISPVIAHRASQLLPAKVAGISGARHTRWSRSLNRLVIEIPARPSTSTSSENDGATGW